MMTWPYIAGFFDGEGCIDARRHGIAMFQNNVDVLNEIAAFLAERGMRSSRFTTKVGKFSRGRKCTVLKYNSKHDVLIFLNGVLPYLIVKKQLAEDVRRYILLFPPLTPKQASVLGNQSSSTKMRALYGKTSEDGRKFNKRVVR